MGRFRAMGMLHVVCYSFLPLAKLSSGVETLTRLFGFTLSWFLFCYFVSLAGKRELFLFCWNYTGFCLLHCCMCFVV